jgi:hypothetical protein
MFFFFSVGFTMVARGDSIFSPLFGEVAIDMARTQGKEKKNLFG